MPSDTPRLRHLVSCPSCSRQVDVSDLDAGTTTSCLCGETLRPSTITPHDAAVVRCSGCGGPRRGGEAACGFCGADFTIHEQDLHTVCPSCAARISDRASFCHHCAQPIVPEPRTAENSSYACPACEGDRRLASRSLGEDRVAVQECRTCAGFWLSTEVFTLLESKAHTQQIFDLESSPKGSSPTSTAPASGRLYRPCPVCQKLMNRLNYGKRSGVVIDVCKEHGIWFDRDELPRILEWIRRGGFERQRAVMHEERRYEAKREQERRAEAKESAFLGHHSAGIIPDATVDVDNMVRVVGFLGRLFGSP